MDVIKELRSIRPSCLAILGSLARFVVFLGIIAAYYNYTEQDVTSSVPAPMVFVACVGFACLGRCGAQITYRLRLGRLIRRLNRY